MTKQPILVPLAAGIYHWCTCGASTHQPFCDGSHRAVEGAEGPLRFRLEEDRKVAMCTCKRTGNPPYCDGSHSDRRPIDGTHEHSDNGGS